MQITVYSFLWVVMRGLYHQPYDLLSKADTPKAFFSPHAEPGLSDLGIVLEAGVCNASLGCRVYPRAPVA